MSSLTVCMVARRMAAPWRIGSLMLAASLMLSATSVRAADVAAWVLQPTGQATVLGSLPPAFPDGAAVGSPAVAIAAGLDAAVPFLAGRAGRVVGGDASTTDVALQPKERTVELLRAGEGLWLVTSRARVLPIAADPPGGPAAVLSGRDVVLDATTTPSRLGAWLLTKTGRILSVGDAAPIAGRAAGGAGAIAADAAGGGLWVAPRKGGLRALLGAPVLSAPRGRLVALSSLLTATGLVAVDKKGQVWLLLPDVAPQRLGRVRGKVADVVAAPRLEQAVVTLDGARAATATIGTEGGLIEASTASGGTIDLVVPAGALPADQTITVTPVIALDGVSAGAGLVAGVDFQPSGLHFAVPLRAILTLPPGAPAGLVAIGWSGPDDRVEFPNWTRSSDGLTATIEVRHFSGTGVVAASAAALALLGEQIAADLPPIFAELNPQIIQTKLALDGARAAGNASFASEKLTLLRRHFSDLHAEGVEPFLAPAAETIPGFLKAVQVAFTFASWLQTIGDDDAGDEAAKTVADRQAIATGARTLVLRYLVPACDAPASILGDWLVHPLFLAASEAQLVDETTITELLTPASGEPPHCLRLVLHELEFPSELTREDRNISLGLQPRYEVTAPGGIGTQRVETTTFQIFGDVSGATVEGEEQFITVTDSTGRTTIQLDRGADADERDSSLTVNLLISPVAPLPTSELPTIFDAPIGIEVQPGAPVPGQLLPITLTRTLTAEECSAAAVVGAWSGTYAGSQSGTWAASFNPSGTTLSGTVSIDGGGATPLTGTIVCNQITFGSVGGVTFDGTVSGTCASGSWHAGDFSGSWSGCKN